MKWSIRWSAVLLLVLLAWGGWLRVEGLERRSLWADELFTLAMGQYYPLVPNEGQSWFRRIQIMEISPDDTFLTAKAAEQSPPLNDLLEKASAAVFGPTEVGARLPAVLFSCLLLVWFAGFAWHHHDPYVRRVLWWSLLVLALYPGLVMYAQEGRAYSVGVSLLGMAGLLWMLRWRNGWMLWHPPGWMEVMLLALASYSHYNATMLAALLLLPDAVMTVVRRSYEGAVRLAVVGFIVLVWLYFNAHAILFTAKGGVAWGGMGEWYQVVWTCVQDAAAVLHVNWLLLALVFFVAMRCVNRNEFRSTDRGGILLYRRMGGIVVLVLLFLVLGAKIAATAGMANPRYYIFVLPFVAVVLGMVFAELDAVAAIISAVFLIAVLAMPSERLEKTISRDDFRSMALAAVKGSNENTVFLYPIAILRDAYRISLHRYLNRDPIEKMVAIGSEQDAAMVCEKLKGTGHVVALGHGLGYELVNIVYKVCGENWTNRSVEQFHHTFTEHWRAP